MGTIDEAVAAIMAARPTFKVGDRVRVLSRPECYYCREFGADEEGLIGIVDRTEHTRLHHGDPDYLRHHIWVTLETEVAGCDLSHFAPTELELLPPPAAPSEGDA